MERKKWVTCLNCGYEYYLEQYTRKGCVKCPKCLSKENDYEESNTATEKRRWQECRK